MVFTGGDMIELIANIIDEHMYAQYDKYGNDMLLLDSFVDYRKIERALSLQDQNLMVNGKPC